MHTTLKQIVRNIQIVCVRCFPGCEEKSAAAKDETLELDGAAAQSCEESQSECRSQSDDTPTDDDAGVALDLYIVLFNHQIIIIIKHVYLFVR